MKKVLLGVLITLAAVFLIGGGYLLGNQSSNTNPSPLQTENKLNSDVAIPTEETRQVQQTFQVPADSTGAPKDVKSLVLEAFTSSNFEVIKPVLSDKVTLISYATGCCGETSDTQKIIDFIKGDPARRGNWELNPTDAKYDKFRSSGLFLIFSTGSALVFDIEGEKIKKVTFYSDYRL